MLGAKGLNKSWKTALNLNPTLCVPEMIRENWVRRRLWGNSVSVTSTEGAWTIWSESRKVDRTKKAIVGGWHAMAHTQVHMLMDASGKPLWNVHFGLTHLELWCSNNPSTHSHYPHCGLDKSYGQGKNVRAITILNWLVVNQKSVILGFIKLFSAIISSVSSK